MTGGVSLRPKWGVPISPMGDRGMPYNYLEIFRVTLDPSSRWALLYLCLTINYNRIQARFKLKTQLIQLSS